MNLTAAQSPHLRELANWIANLRYADLPPRTREVVRIAVLDTVGAGVYGYNAVGADAARVGTARRCRQRGCARLGDAKSTLRCSDAALVNGTASHAFGLDDYHNAKLHPGAVGIPAAIAVAEKLDASGADLITAIAAGYDVMIRSSLALNPSAARLRGWHLTGVCGPFGAAAACASLLKLNPEQTAWALGLAGTQGAGLWAFNADGTMSKRLHAGKAAHSGVLAAELAQSLHGPTQIYETEDGGVLKASGSSDPPRFPGLGTVFTSTNLDQPYPAAAARLYIDAALALRRKLGTVDATRRVQSARAWSTQCGFTTRRACLARKWSALHGRGRPADGQVLPAQFTS